MLGYLQSNGTIHSLEFHVFRFGTIMHSRLVFLITSIAHFEIPIFRVRNLTPDIPKHLAATVDKWSIW